MIWVGIFLFIALAGAVMTVSYAIWLWHKTSDLLSELGMLGTRAEELAALLSQLRLPEAPSSTTGNHN